MGYISHRALLVTCCMDEGIEALHDKATEICAGTCDVSPISLPGMNGYQSFCVFPDGSGRGKSRSKEAEAARTEYISWLNERLVCCSWALVMYGDENGIASVLNHDAR